MSPEASAILHRIYRHPVLKKDEVEAIAAAHERVSFRKGEYLLREGQISDEYFCLESGLIRAFATSSEGNEVTTGFFSTGDVVIEVASLFLKVPTKENVQALNECSCWRISFDTFQSLFETIDGFSEWGRTWMSAALFGSKQRSLSMITDSATERYLALLADHPEIIQQAPLKVIASYLGITDTSLSRIRKEVGRTGR